MNINRLFFLLLASAALCNSMELPMENGATNQALAKYSGCFVAIKDTWVRGYSLTSDPSLAFAYIHPGDATAKGFIGYCIFVLRKRCPEGIMPFGLNVPCAMPEALCAKPGLYLRMASSQEIATTQEKINNSELELGTIRDSKQALEFLRLAAAKMYPVYQTNKRRENTPLVRSSKRIRRPAKNKSGYFTKAK